MKNFFKNKKIFFFVILFSIFYFLFSILPVFAQIKFTPQIPIPGLQVKEVGAKSIAGYISAFYQWSVTAIAIIAVVMIMVSGIQWILAAGNPPAIQKARDQMISAIIGLILALLAIPLLNLINPALTRLSTFYIPSIGRVALDIESEFFILKTDECDGLREYAEGSTKGAIFAQMSPEDFYQYIKNSSVNELDFPNESGCLVVKSIYPKPEEGELFAVIKPEKFMIRFEMKKDNKWKEREGSIMSLTMNKTPDSYSRCYYYYDWSYIPENYKYWVYLISGKRQGHELFSTFTTTGRGDELFKDYTTIKEWRVLSSFENIQEAEVYDDEGRPTGKKKKIRFIPSVLYFNIK